MTRRKRDNGGGDGRSGVSEVLGVLILLLLTMTSMAFIFLTGDEAVSGVQSAIQDEEVKNQMSLLDSRIATAALGEGSVERLQFNLKNGQMRTNPDESWMRVTLNNSTGEHVLHNTTMGSIVYEGEDITLSYEGGGVWMSNPGTAGSSMVSSPEFLYRGNTLTLPMFNLTSSVSRKGEQTTIAVDAEETDVVGGYAQPLKNGTINVTVRSDYYDAWAKYFDERTEGDIIDVWDSNRTAKISLPVPEPGDYQNAVEAGIQGSGSDESLTLSTAGLIDQYDSDVDSYDDTKNGTDAGDCHSHNKLGEPGVTVILRGQTTIQGTCIYGNVLAYGPQSGNNGLGSGIKVDGGGGKPYIKGTLHSSQKINVENGIIEGGLSGIKQVRLGDGAEVKSGAVINVSDSAGGGGQGQLRCDDTVDLTGVEIHADQIKGDCVNANLASTNPAPPKTRSDVDNPDDPDLSPPALSGESSPCIDSNGNINANSWGGDTCVMDDGEYVVGEITLGDADKTLVLNINDGGIEMDVGGGVSIQGTLRIEADDRNVDNRATMYLTNGADFSVDPDDTAAEGVVTDPKQTAHFFEVIGGPKGSDHSVTLNEGVGVGFTGVVYAPYNSLDVEGMDVYGSIIGDPVQTDNNLSVHYDQDLGDRSVGDGAVSQVYYLHVTENRVEVE